MKGGVYRMLTFKSGHETDLAVKLFSIAISRIRAIQENKHRAVLVPIPASTREKNRIRYEEFCRNCRRTSE